jgi:ELWxxDGT repeat protein
MGNVVFFQGTSPGSPFNLWVSDGTPVGTFSVGGAQNAGVAGTDGGLFPLEITPFGAGVLFSGSVSNHRGLWFSDGTAAGTHEIGGAEDGVAGGNPFGLNPTDITVFGNKALFFGSDLDVFNGLWVTDGTTSGTFELGGLKNSGISGRLFSGLAPEDLTPAGNKVFFVGSDTDNDRSLWVTDGTTSGTVEVGGLNNAGISAGPGGVPFSVSSNDRVSFGNDIIFSGGNTIWVSDGTASGTVDIAPHLFGVSDLTVFGTKVLFDAGAFDGESALWITDGTAAGTTEIGGPENEAIPGTVGADLGGISPRDFTVFGDKALFTGSDSTLALDALWVTDGTVAGTMEIGGLKNAGISGAGKHGLVAQNLVSIGAKVLFLGDDPSGVNVLWVSDGTVAGTFELGGVNNVGVAGAPAAGLDPESITASGGKGYFFSPDSTGAERLWVSDGTVAGTHVVAAGPTGLVTNGADLTAALGSSPLPVTGDIFWQNASTGQGSIWDMDGSALVGGGPLSPNPGPSWTEIGTGDFNDDGHADILWQKTSGQASIWDMNANSLIGGGPVSPNPRPAWKAVGTGDFTDDGYSDDILWQNTSSGQVSIWEMSGNKLTGGGPVSPNPGPSWKAIGTGDFNKDGSSDILWQNTSTGQVSIWEMHGNALIGGGPVSPNPGPSWHAIGTGDFNHDGFSDILFQNASTGQLSIWEMKGNTLVGGGPVSPNPGPSWRAIGTDGGSDILFQNTSGQASIWDRAGPRWSAAGRSAPIPGRAGMRSG